MTWVIAGPQDVLDQFMSGRTVDINSAARTTAPWSKIVGVTEDTYRRWDRIVIDVLAIRKSHHERQ